MIHNRMAPLNPLSFATANKGVAQTSRIHVRLLLLEELSLGIAVDVVPEDVDVAA